MAKKIIIIIFIFILTACLNTPPGQCATKGRAVYDNSTKISKGVMIQAYPLKTITTAALDEGDIVYFINPSDLWAYEINVIPKNSYFRGYVEMLKMPVKGINAAMVIRITEVILPDGTIKRIGATVTQSGTPQIGGNLTPPASYNKTVHPREGMYWKRAGVLQYVPSGDYEMGMHVTLPTSDPVYIILDEEYDSKGASIQKEEMFQYY